MDNLYNFGFVKFISRFYTPDRIGKWINKIIEMYNTNSFKSQAGTLLTWAIIIIIIATAIDLTFFWMRAEQQIVLTKYVSRFRDALSGRR